MEPQEKRESVIKITDILLPFLGCILYYVLLRKVKYLSSVIDVILLHYIIEWCLVDNAVLLKQMSIMHVKYYKLWMVYHKQLLVIRKHMHWSTSTIAIILPHTPQLGICHPMTILAYCLSIIYCILFENYISNMFMIFPPLFLSNHDLTQSLQRFLQHLNSPFHVIQVIHNCFSDWYAITWLSIGEWPLKIQGCEEAN